MMAAPRPAADSPCCGRARSEDRRLVCQVHSCTRPGAAVPIGACPRLCWRYPDLRRTSMTETLKIRGLGARPVLVPFRRPPTSASGALPTAALVLIDLETDGG